MPPPVTLCDDQGMTAWLPDLPTAQSLDYCGQLQSKGYCSRNPDFAHPLLMIPRTCGVPIGETATLLALRMIMSNRARCSRGRTRLARTNAAKAVTESYPLSSSTG